MSRSPGAPHERMEIGSSVPRTRRPVLRWLAHRIIHMLGWRFDVRLPDLPKLVVLAAPHTSNVDGILAILSILALDLRIGLFVKHTAFRAPFGGLLRRLGAIPIDRTAPGGLIGQTIEAFRVEPQLLIALAPEGTRSRAEKWKRGFHLIASGARVPVVCSFLDYRRKLIGTGLVLEQCADYESDLAKVQGFYRGITPRVPERFSSGG